MNTPVATFNYRNDPEPTDKYFLESIEKAAVTLAILSTRSSRYKEVGLRINRALNELEAAKALLTSGR